MKRCRWFALLIATALTVTACGGSAKGTMDAAMPEESVVYEYADDFVEESATEVTESGISAGGELSSTVETARKLIRTFDIDIQTKEFDAVYSGIQKKVQELGGYIEQSSLDSGSAYYSSYNRYSYMTVRIPSDRLDQFVDNVKETANVTNISETADDITLRYVDVESRKTALETERDRLLELLEQAETVEEIITIESRLSEVRYELEAYASTLRTYDNQVDYSTVHLSIREVDRETKVEPKTFWEEVEEAFKDSTYGLTKDARNFAIWFLGSTPYLILWAVIAVLAVYVLKYVRKKREMKSILKRTKAEEDLPEDKMEQK